MVFDLTKCVNYISENTTKKVSEVFAKWLSAYGITRSQWIALYHIHTKGEISQRQLSKAMNINDSSAMRLIDRLERDEHLIRVRSQIDRRVINLKLTDQGEKLILSLLPVGEEFSALLKEDISEEELIIFQKVLGKMLSNVQNDPRSK